MAYVDLDIKENTGIYHSDFRICKSSFDRTQKALARKGKKI
jgi:hypothetical protein